MFRIITFILILVAIGVVIGVAVSALFLRKDLRNKFFTSITSWFGAAEVEEEDEEELKRKSILSFRIDAAKVLHEVAAIDSTINSQEHAAFVEHFYQNFETQAQSDKEHINLAFRDGELEGRNLAEKIASFYWTYSARKKELLALTQIAIEIIIVDGAKNGSEAHVLDTVARSFGIHPKELFRMEEQILQDYYERMGYSSKKSAQRQGASSNNASSSSSSKSGSSKNRAKQDRKRNSNARYSAKSSSTLSQYYTVLECSAKASRSELKRSYRKLVKRYHPDHAGSDSSKADRFRAVQEAYDALRRAGKA